MEIIVRTKYEDNDLVGTSVPHYPVNIRGVLHSHYDFHYILPRSSADMEEYVAPPGHDVTFNLDMFGAENFNQEQDTVFISGDLLDWVNPGSDIDNQMMIRIEESMIYTKTLRLETGSYEYKYYLNSGWQGGESKPGVTRTLTVNENMIVNDTWGDQATHVSELRDDEIKIYPNPARQNFIVEAENLIQVVMIVDISGKNIYQAESNENRIEISQNFDSGVYFVHIYTETGVNIKKLIIQN
jgi:hypothetical protein